MNPWMNDANKLRELKPKHILFLCVTNSVRGQNGEGGACKINTATCGESDF